MKMGPFRMNDLVGLDFFGRERANSGAATPDTVVMDALYAAGRFGQKNGKGFYKYNKRLRMSADAEADVIVQQVWKNRGVATRSLTKEEIVNLLYFPAVNEGFKYL